MDLMRIKDYIESALLKAEDGDVNVSPTKVNNIFFYNSAIKDVLSILDLIHSGEINEE